MNEKEKNKTVLVTGSSRGIGKGVALYLANKGYDIVLHCRSKREEALEVQKEIKVMGRKARVLQFDVNDRELADKILTEDVEKNGSYYGVICNAGITADGPFPIMTGKQWDDVVGTSLNGFYNIVHPIVMSMISSKKPGRIITLSSVSGVSGNRGQVNYSAAKSGLIGATKALALELAKRRITVNSIAPGFIDTDMTKDLPVEEVKKYIPMRRFGTVEEVAAAISFLLSEDAGYITRQVISVNGGLV